MKKILLAFLVTSSLVFANALTLGIVPQQSPLKLSKKWLQITEYLKSSTGLDVVFKTEKSIPDFENKLYNGEYDISYMNPYHFIIANEKQNYEAFVRAKKNIVGILVSNDDKVEFSKENLEGKRFLFPAPNAFAATLLTKYELKHNFGFDIDKQAEVLYVNSHDSVYKGVSRGVGYIGGGIIRTYDNFKSSDDKEKINIVYKTSEYPSHPIAYHPRVDLQTIKKLEKAFLEMPENLKELLSIKEFKQINSSEYDVIKELKVK